MHLLSFDFEDWYQLTSDQLGSGDVARPDALERQLDRLLGLLERHSTRATFFVLGKSVESRPGLVRRIAEAGHEVATHGWGHRFIFEIGLEAFREDLTRSIAFLEDLSGKPVRGHRAPAFSVRPEQLEGFYEVCLEAGLLYDSSVVPYAGRRYGIPGASRAPFVALEKGGRRLWELPLSTLEFGSRRFPIAGGGWWRVSPGGFLSRAIRAVERDGLPFITYFHPYEFDDRRLDGLSILDRSPRALLWTLKQNLGRRSMMPKLDSMLGRFRFVPAEELIDDRQSG